MTQASPKGPTNTITSGGGSISTGECWGDANIQTTVELL